MILFTRRLLLRPFRDSDFPTIRDLYANPEARRYEGPLLDEVGARQRLQRLMGQVGQPLGTFFGFAVTVSPDDLARGWITLTQVNAEAQEYEIGWALCPSDWHQGYATEAARAVLRFAFIERNAHRIIAFCHAGNTASYHVMERLGMQREGYLRETRILDGKYYDELVYAILEREYTDHLAE